MDYIIQLEKRGQAVCGALSGAHLEKEPNRYQRLKLTHPNLYNYSINKLELGEVLDYINVKY